MFKFILGTTQQVKLWAFFAASIPMTALGFVWFLDMIGWTDLYHKTLVVGGTTFFFVAIFWWWWAVFKIAELALLIETANLKFDDVKDELSNIRNDLKSIN